MAGNNFDAIVIGSGITGGMVIGGDLFLSGCTNTKDPKTFFSKETIVADCFYPAEQKLFTEGISQLNKLCIQKFGKEFITCTAQNRTYKTGW